MVKYHL